MPSFKPFSVAVGSLLAATLLPCVAALAPGSYTIQSVAFPQKRITGPGVTTEGTPLLAFPITGAPVSGVRDDQIEVWTVDSTQTLLSNEFAGVFVMTDATHTGVGGMIGQGVFTVAAPDPQPPLLPIGAQSWEFIQAESGTIIALAGTDLVWSLATDSMFTSVVLAEINTGDLRQQFLFTPQALV